MGAAGRGPTVATREAPLENRTALCMAPQLPPRGHPLGATRRELPGHDAARICPDLAPGIYEIAFGFRLWQNLMRETWNIERAVDESDPTASGGAAYQNE